MFTPQPCFLCIVASNCSCGICGNKYPEKNAWDLLPPPPISFCSVSLWSYTKEKGKNQRPELQFNFILNPVALPLLKLM